jgi:hypothetical protein
VHTGYLWVNNNIRCFGGGIEALQNQKTLVFLGVHPWCSLVRLNFRGVPSCSKENVLGKDYLLERNQYKNFQDVINAYIGTSNRIRGVPSCSKENVLGKDHLSQRN